MYSCNKPSSLSSLPLFFFFFTRLLLHSFACPRASSSPHQILSIRAATCSLELEEEALAYMGEIGARTSLRYAVQMLSPAKILAETAGREAINQGDIEEVDQLFFDAKASAKLLAEQEDKYLQ